MDTSLPTHAALETFRASIALLQTLPSALETHADAPADEDEDGAAFDLTPHDHDHDAGDGDDDAAETSGILAALHALEADLHEAKAALDHLDDAASSLDHLEPLIGHLTQASSHAEDTIDDLHHRHETVVQSSHALSSAIGERHATHANEHLSNALHHVSDELTHEFDQAVDALHDGAIHRLDEWLSHSNSSGDELTHLWESLLHEAATELGNTLKDELKHAFDELVQRGVQILAKKFAEAVTEATAGAATTTALSEALPALIAAKKALQLINTMKGFIGL